MLVRRIARPMLASIFITEGIDALRHPAPKAAVAEPVLDRIATAARPAAEHLAHDVEDAAAASSGTVEVPDAVHNVAAAQPLPFQTSSYVKANGAVHLSAGILLATGKLPRLASAALAASLVPTTLAGHRFWELDGDERQAQRIHFTKNVALLGGLILAAIDTEGRPDLIHRATQLSADAKSALGSAKPNTTATDLGHRVAQIGSDVGHVLVDRGSDLTAAAVAQAHTFADAARASDLPARVATRASEVPTLIQSGSHDFIAAVRDSPLPDIAGSLVGARWPAVTHPMR